MDTVYQRCCGLDVHQKRVTACVITPEGQEVRSFSAMTKDLLALADWLAGHQVTQVAMESTGVYWKPVYNILEDEFSVMVVNARHMKAVPGRKTDVKSLPVLDTGTPSGSPTCCVAACCRPASSRSARSGSCGN